MIRRAAPIPPSLLLGAVLLAALAGGSTGCGEPLDPFNRLTKLRVLAIRSEPAAPAPGETAAFDALIYASPGDSAATWRWSWCPFSITTSEDHECAVSEEEARVLAGDDLPSYDLGAGETAAFEHALDPTLLALLCENTAVEAGLLDCEGGFPVQIKLTVTSQDGQEITAARELRLRFDEAQEANANPAIQGLTALLGDQELAVGYAPDVTLPRGEVTPMRAEISPDTIESYTAIDDDGDPEDRVERLILTWFVESGDTEDERNAFIDGVVTLEDAVLNEWEPDVIDDYAPETSEVIVVVRDDRDGVTWHRGVVALESNR